MTIMIIIIYCYNYLEVSYGREIFLSNGTVRSMMVGSSSFMNAIISLVYI